MWWIFCTERVPAHSWSNRTFLTISAAGCCWATAWGKVGWGVKRIRQEAGKKGSRKEEIQNKLDLGLDLKSGMGGERSRVRAVRWRTPGRMSRPEMWLQMFLEETGSKSKQGREWDKGQTAETACGHAATNLSRRLGQNPKLQMHSMSLLSA